MTLISTNPTGTQAWQKLRNHYEDIAYFPMVEMFAQDPQRAQKFHIKWNDFLLDFSKNKINETTMSLLVELAHAMNKEQFCIQP
jgi:glucose-6-phosphate isomerase